MFSRSVSGRFRFVLLLALLVLATVASPGNVLAGDDPGAVFVLTNEVVGNQVAIFERAADGSLTAAGTVATGGLGTGAGLGSQGALVLSENNRWLLAVNPGSNEVSIFAVEPDGLRLTDTVASGGAHPISVAIHGSLVYVLNSGGDGNISGFTLDAQGHLTPLSDSTRPLSTSAAGPAQISFRPDGRQLVVTEKATNRITSYLIGQDGRPTGPATYPSAGTTPFGFAFTNQGLLLVSEAFGGAADASAVSSYGVRRDGTVEVITPSLGTTESAACWLVVTKNGKFAYTTNAGSGSISGLSVGRDGTLALLDADGRTGETGAGSAPTDAALSRNSQYLYVLGSGNDTINAFAVQADGSLSPLPGVAGLVATSVGLAAY